MRLGKHINEVDGVVERTRETLKSWDGAGCVRPNHPAEISLASLYGRPSLFSTE